MVLFSKIYSSFPRNEPCPCDSGEKAKNCCLTNNEWNKIPADINPKSPKTNLFNKNCFASVTNDCDSKITDEHYISQSVLKQINKDGNKVKIQGSSWLNDNESKDLPTSSLVTKNLCKRHNEALSPLDSEASRFFEILDSYNNSFKGENYSEEIKVFCGEDLERWLLKTALGILESGQLKNDGQPLKLKLPDNLIKILYGQYNWPKGWGLHISEETITYQSSIGCTPIVDRELNNLIGMKFRINNFVYNLAFKLANDSRKTFGIHRPKTLVFSDGKVKKYIELCWQDKSNQFVVEMFRTKKNDNQALQ